MARRPNVFDQKGFENSLRNQGCVESFIAPITSDYRIFVPIVLRELGEEKLFRIVNGVREELKLGAADEAWKVACKYIVGWAEEEVEKYKEQK